MPTVKQSVGIAITIAMTFGAATAFGISAVEENFWALSDPENCDVAAFHPSEFM
jgi:hypothetical protein